ncbi:MAG: exodeoxyribonuclease V subunit gamma [Actinomycetota bacterium]
MIHLTFGTNLERLAEPLATFHFNSPGDELEPLWTVVPTMAFRQWLDQAVASSGKDDEVSIAANLVAIFPKDLAIRIEQLALGEAWVDWSTETTALRLLSILNLESFAVALKLAQAIDDVVHWRPHLLESANQHLLPIEVAAAMEAIAYFEEGPQVQRALVLAKIRAGEVEGLPNQLAVFGLSTVPGGRRFLELLETLGTQLRVHAFLPVPSIAWLAELQEHVASRGTEQQVSFSWLRDLTESTAQWLEFGQVEAIVDSSTPPHSVLDVLRSRILNESFEELSRDHEDASVRFLGGFGRSRQVEQLRDALLELVASGVAPHEILVVCPDPPAFQAALERHWNYQSWQGEQGPRLPFELLEVAPNGLRNRLAASISLLQLIGNYATIAQVISFLSFPAVATTLGLSSEDIETVSRRADEGKLIFGVSAEQRARFGVYPSSPNGD